MKKHETKFSLLFRHWLRAHPITHSCTFELKDTRGKDSFPFKEYKEEQELWANAITYGKGVLIRNQGGSGEPDYNYHYQDPAYIVIKYPAGFVLIHVEDFVAERERSERKSLTWDRAQELDVKIP